MLSMPLLSATHWGRRLSSASLGLGLALFLLSPLAPAQADGYTAPDLGKPSRRTGAGTRSGEDQMILQVLAPLKTGLSATPQPLLYWTVSEKPSEPVTLTLTANPRQVEKAKVIKEVSLPVEEAGWQVISLAELDISLEPDTDYEWAISLSGPKRRTPVVASGVVRYAPPPDSVREARAQNLCRQAENYAEAGFWYQALAEVSIPLSEENPRADSETLQACRRQLLARQDLAEALNEREVAGKDDGQ